MISTPKKSSAFLSSFDALAARLQKDSPSWLSDIRQGGVHRFQKVGLPTVKDEEWKYTNVAALADKTFHLPSDHSLLEESQLKNYIADCDIVLVFINGLFSKKYSQTAGLPQGCSVANLAEISSDAKKTIQDYLDRYSSENEDAFAALNRSLMHHGAVITIGKNAVIKPLIHVVHVASGRETDILLSPRTLIVLEESSEAQIMESHLSFASLNYFTNAVTDVFLKPDAKLRYYKAQNENQNAFHVATIRFWQEKDSQLDSFSFSTGAKLARNNLTVTLNGEGASAVLNGLYAATGEQLVDNHTAVDHRMPNATSNQLYKGILDGNAKAVFNGKIFVKQIAQKTNSYQLNKNLLLGAGCQVNTKPQLEIFADDVKCTHGATIGQLNEDEMFYLQSRSIPKKTAVKILSRGFVNDILDRVGHPSAREKMDQFLTKAFAVLS